MAGTAPQETPELAAPTDRWGQVSAALVDPGQRDPLEVLHWIHGPPGAPAYVYMWSVAIPLFVVTYLEGHLYLSTS